MVNAPLQGACWLWLHWWLSASHEMTGAHQSTGWPMVTAHNHWLFAFSDINASITYQLFGFKICWAHPNHKIKQRCLPYYLIQNKHQAQEVHCSMTTVYFITGRNLTSIVVSIHCTECSCILAVGMPLEASLIKAIWDIWPFIFIYIKNTRNCLSFGGQQS